MSIPPCGTFKYAGVIPDDQNHSSGRWRLLDQSGAGSSAGGDSLIDDRLVGLQPTLEIVDAGSTPDVRVSPYTGSVRPKVLLSRAPKSAYCSEGGRVLQDTRCSSNMVFIPARPVRRNARPFRVLAAALQRQPFVLHSCRSTRISRSQFDGDCGCR